MKNQITGYGSIIVHYLTSEAASLINHIEHNNIMWIEWGGDMYNSFLMRKGFTLYSDYNQYLKFKFKFCPYWLAKILLKIKREYSFAIRYNAVKKSNTLYLIVCMENIRYSCHIIQSLDI